MTCSTLAPGAAESSYRSLCLLIWLNVCVCLCVCSSHRWLFGSTFSPWVYSPEPDYASSFKHGGVLTRLLQALHRPRQAVSALLGLTPNFSTPPVQSSPVQHYSGCSGWVCRPFSGRVILWFTQKALCSWSSSDTRGRPMSKCIFRFSSHSSSLEKAGLEN